MGFTEPDRLLSLSLAQCYFVHLLCPCPAAALSLSGAVNYTPRSPVQLFQLLTDCDFPLLTQSWLQLLTDCYSYPATVPAPLLSTAYSPRSLGALSLSLSFSLSLLQLRTVIAVAAVIGCHRCDC